MKIQDPLFKNQEKIALKVLELSVFLSSVMVL